MVEIVVEGELGWWFYFSEAGDNCDFVFGEDKFLEELEVVDDALAAGGVVVGQIDF